MKITKRLVSILLTLCMSFAYISGVCAEEAETKPSEVRKEYAAIYFDGKGKNVNIAHYGFQEGAETYEVKDGIKALVLNGGTTIATFCDLRMADGVFEQNRAYPISIKARYFDEGTGYFSFRYYDGVTSYKCNGERIVMTDSKEWKEYTFHFDDMYFNRNIGGGDFQIAVFTENYRSTPVPVYIQSLEIEKCFPMKPVIAGVSSDYHGNAIGGDQEKKINLSFQNMSMVDMNVSYKYSVLSYDKKVISEGESGAVSVKGENTENIPVDLPVSDYGCYYIKLEGTAEYELDGEKKTYEIPSGEYDFSIYNRRLEDEPTNKLMKAHSHHSKFLGDAAEEAQYFMDAGLSGLRSGAPWYDIEAWAGQYSSTKFTQRFILPQADLGMENIVSIGGTPALYGMSSSWTAVPDPDNTASMLQWEKYIDYITKQYAGKIKYYEYGNEPNLWSQSATTYTNAFKRAYPIIKKNDPEAITLFGATAQAPIGWFKEAFEAGALDYCDMLSIHPYDWTGTGINSKVDNENFKAQITDLKALLAEYGHPDMPIVITEMGQRAHHLYYNSYVGQAAIMTQVMAICAGEKLVESVAIYEWRDDVGGAETTSNWGLVKGTDYTVPYAAKPFFVAMAEFNKLLTDAEPLGYIENGDTKAYRFKSAKNGKNVTVLWSDGSAEAIGLDLGTNEVEILDMYGNSKGKIHSENGVYSFLATFEPQYIIGNFEKMEFAEPIIATNDGRCNAPAGDVAVINFTDKLSRNLRMEVATAKNLEILEKQDMTDGKAKIKLAVSGEAEQDNEVSIAFYDGDELVYTTKAHVMIVDAIGVENEMIEYKEGVANRFSDAVHITNRNNETPISGTVSSDMTSIGGNYEVRKFKNVKPGETVTVFLNLPKQITKHTLSLENKIELENGYSKTQTVPLSQNIAGYAYQKPSLTGKVNPDDWSGGEWFAADNKYDARYYNGWGGTKDLSFTGTVKWDEENMYLITIVEDDTFCQDYEGYSVWKGDGVQVGFSRLEESASVTGEYTELGLTKTKSGNVIWRYNSQTMYNTATTDMKANVAVESGELTVENYDGKLVYRARIPWNEIFGEGAKGVPDDIVGFSILVNDNDGGGRGWLEYCSGIGTTKDTSLYGKMILAK